MLSPTTPQRVPNLLTALQKLLPRLEDDLRERASLPEHDAGLRDAYAQAKKAERTAEPFESWRDAYVTQVAVAWLMSGVFVRFIEDNDLIDVPLISGPTEAASVAPASVAPANVAPARGNRWKRADDEYQLYFREHPTHSDRDWFLHVFSTIQALPAAADLFRKRNLVWALGPSGDMAGVLRAFWRRIDPGTGALEHDFSGHRGDTRFLGDLYQDLSEDARKRYALLQTPEFVEEFILDRALTPALAEFGLEGLRLIDPTCGSGHFLLGAFHRLLEAWRREAPAEPDRELVRRALDGVYGVDLNPFAVAIARFRLLEAALHEARIGRLKEAPAWAIHVTVADSLIHGRQWRRYYKGDEGQAQAQMTFVEQHAGFEAGPYGVEDPDEVNEILGHQYHVVVGNPPYITVKDPGPRELYRRRYVSAAGKYSLGVPFTERFFDLALPVKLELRAPAGYVGMITANSFMKREFGAKLIEEVMPHLDLTHVLDTAGAYIPGHGTPTVILIGRNQEPTCETVRAALGIKGEPSTPEAPAQGDVWRSIAENLDQVGFENEFVSIVNLQSAILHKHPWSLGGGGAGDLKEAVEENATRLISGISSIGFGAIMGEDEAFFMNPGSWSVASLRETGHRPLIEGELVRDWGCSSQVEVIFPYDGQIMPKAGPELNRRIWFLREVLGFRKVFGGLTYRQAGKGWFEYHQIPIERNRIPSSITFSFVATHNNFVFDRGGKVFNRSAPVIKLPATATEDDHLVLAGILNSSAAAFWMRQVFFAKGGAGIGRGIQDEAWETRLEYDGTKLQEFPLPPAYEQTLDLARELDALAREAQARNPAMCVKSATQTRALLDANQQKVKEIHARMIALQEELDWRCYRLYGLVPDESLEADPATLPGIEFGERAFEISMGRKVAAGTLKTAWFERHRPGWTPITEPPAHWPAAYKALVERRMALLEQDRNIGLIEKPEHKRRWSREPWADQVARTLRSWLLDRLETPRYFPQAVRMTAGGEGADATGHLEPALVSCSHLADLASRDADFLQVGALYRQRQDFDVQKLVTELVLDEAVPFLPVQRYKESGLRKRAQWEQTWALQRLEDALEVRVKLPESDPRRLSPAAREAAWQEELRTRGQTAIPVPPKYTSADFLAGPTWRLRGKLDVPKERFILYPGGERDADGSPVVAWAGLDHLEQARALSAWYLERKDVDGWSPERLKPLLAGLDQLVPWLEQWHHDYDPMYSGRPCDAFRDFVADECRALDLGLEDLRSWTPPAKGGRGPAQRKAGKGAAGAEQGSLF